MALQPLGNWKPAFFMAISVTMLFWVAKCGGGKPYHNRGNLLFMHPLLGAFFRLLRRGDGHHTPRAWPAQQPDLSGAGPELVDVSGWTWRLRGLQSSTEQQIVWLLMVNMSCQNLATTSRFASASDAKDASTVSVNLGILCTKFSVSCAVCCSTAHFGLVCQFGMQSVNRHGGDPQVGQLSRCSCCPLHCLP